MVVMGCGRGPKFGAKGRDHRPRRRAQSTGLVAGERVLVKRCAADAGIRGPISGTLNISARLTTFGVAARRRADL